MLPLGIVRRGNYRQFVQREPGEVAKRLHTSGKGGGASHRGDGLRPDLSGNKGEGALPGVRVWW